MNREDIIRMAREAGFVDYELDDYTPSGYDIRYERFASLVAAAAKAEEREACAKVVEDVEQSPNPIINMTNRLAAAAIRARGQA